MLRWTRESVLVGLAEADAAKAVLLVVVEEDEVTCEEDVVVGKTADFLCLLDCFDEDMVTTRSRGRSILTNFYNTQNRRFGAPHTLQHMANKNAC